MFQAIPWDDGLLIGLLAFAAEFIDSSLGMGYGTTLTPLLMLVFGFEPLQIVPAVLLSELATGLVAGFTHHSVGNVDLRPKTLRIDQIIRKLREHGVTASWQRGIPLHLKITLIIALCSGGGTVTSVLRAVSLPVFWLSVYLGALVLAVGLVILATLRHTYPFSWRRVIALGLIASFNKGISGGGYGPVVTGGQLLAGVEGRSAVGITSLAEGLTCLVGVLMYLAQRRPIDWTLAPYLVVGGLLSVPLAAVSVRAVRTSTLRALIGIATVILGLLTLAKILGLAWVSA